MGSRLHRKPNMQLAKYPHKFYNNIMDIIIWKPHGKDDSVRITTYSSPCYLLEAAELVYALVNGVEPETLTADGEYCIPPDQMRQICDTACASLSSDDPRLQFYFSGVPIENALHRSFCLARCLFYVSMNVDCSDVDSALAAMSASWSTIEEPMHITGLYGYSLGIDTPQSSFSSLSQEVSHLPLPVSCQIRLVEVLADPDKHLRAVGELLRPVAKALEMLLQPWVEKAQPLLAQWENFFRQEDAHSFLQQRFRLDQSKFNAMHLALRYLSPNHIFGSLHEPDGSLHFHLGIHKAVGKLDKKPEVIDERDFAALRLMANPARAEILRLLTDRPMAVQSVATTLGMHVGSVFRDINNLFNANLLLVSLVGGRNCYRTNISMVHSLTQRLDQFISAKGPQAQSEN